MQTRASFTSRGFTAPQMKLSSVPPSTSRAAQPQDTGLQGFASPEAPGPGTSLQGMGSIGGAGPVKDLQTRGGSLQRKHGSPGPFVHISRCSTAGDSLAHTDSAFAHPRGKRYGSMEVPSNQRSPPQVSRCLGQTPRMIHASSFERLPIGGRPLDKSFKWGSASFEEPVDQHQQQGPQGIGGSIRLKPAHRGTQKIDLCATAEITPRIGLADGGEPENQARVADAERQTLSTHFKRIISNSEDGSIDTSPPSRNQESTQSLAQPPSEKPSSNLSYTSEQWRAFQELEQAEMLCEFRRLEINLAEERSRNAELQKLFATELMAQKDAHARDVIALEDMVGKVLNENKRLSGMVEQLCGKVVGDVIVEDSVKNLKQSRSGITEKHNDADMQRTISDAEVSTESEHLATSSSDDSPLEKSILPSLAAISREERTFAFNPERVRELARPVYTPID